jgi:penicillin-binding protein 2
MSFHPNDMRRRGIAANVIVSLVLLFLGAGFFRTQVLEHAEYKLQSETNRLREVPLPAPRGVIYDRNGKPIADNVVGYSVSVLAQKEDTLRAVLERLSGTINITPGQIEQAVRRFRRSPTRPAVILPDASFDVVSVLEEHRTQYPGLIIQSSPRRFYPDGPIVAPFVGYTGEINEGELAKPEFEGYKAGQQVGKGGLERAYESQLRGREGSQFVEVDARGRVVAGQGTARPDLLPVAGPPLYTNIDLDLQRYVASIFGDSLIGGAVAMDPKTGAVLALYSAPTPDYNRFIGGVPAAYYDSLLKDPRHPLYNKALQGTYPPGSTWKLATTVMGLEQGAVTMADRMPIPCTGGMQYGNRYFRCWDKRGHGNLTLSGAIVRRLLLPAWHQAGPRAARGRRGRARIPEQGRDRSSRRAAPAVPREPRVLQPQIREELEPVDRAEHGDRAGRQLADGSQHGALLHGARDRRGSGQAGDRARKAGARTDHQAQ